MSVMLRNFFVWNDRLNVPYDCGLFFTGSSKSLQDVFGPGGQIPAYLTSSLSSSIPSPLNVNIENSRRFRALPLYCSLIAYGKEGYSEIVQRNVSFARKVEAWLRASDKYDVLTPAPSSDSNKTQREDEAAKFRILNIVLFAPSHVCGKPEFIGEDGGTRLVTALNAPRDMYVTGTKWRGRTAARMAVSNWQTGRDEMDFKIVVDRLKAVMER